MPVIVMAQPMSQAHPISEQQQSKTPSLPVMVASGVAGLVLVATLVLWFHYGTQVFFEMIRTGLSACF